MHIEPLFARVILERPLEEVTKGGIIIAENYQKLRAQNLGIVKSVGETCDDSVKGLLGKTVMFAKFAGDWLKLPNGVEYYICQDEDILGVIHE